MLAGTDPDLAGAHATARHPSTTAAPLATPARMALASAGVLVAGGLLAAAAAVGAFAVGLYLGQRLGAPPARRLPFDARCFK